MFLHLQNAMHVTLYIIGRAFISSSSKKTMYTKMSSVHGSSVLTVRDLPLLYDIIGGFKKRVFSKG